jgi:murein DD-endopeptidase MepM/ murein hydrolase activator NlpD
MKKTIILFIIFLLFCAVNAFGANEPSPGRLSVTPGEIPEGSPFVVRVLDSGISERPSGAFSGRRLSFSSCGQGCYEAIGIAPIGITPGDYNIKLNAGMGIESLALRVLKGKFGSQSLTIPQDKVNLSPGDKARANAEAAEMRALWRKRTDRLWEGSFIMPLEGDFSTAFGVRRTINKTKLSIHSGVDIRGGYGTPIKAANTGVVVMAKETFYGGNTIVMDHGQGVYTVYMHMQEFIASLSEVVSKGDIIGLVGSTGRSTGPHLHYTIKVDRSSANPTDMSALPLEGAEGVTAQLPSEPLPYE